MSIPDIDAMSRAIATRSSRRGALRALVATILGMIGVRADDAEAQSSCSWGQIYCQGSYSWSAGSCVNTNSDRNNCGGCGRQCPSGTTCSMGQCECGWGKSFCRGSYSWDPGSCTDTNSDRNNCGGCGRQCPSGTTCSMGQCECGWGESFCPGSYSWDSGSCTDTNSDRNNCGGCGLQCPSETTCSMGQCECEWGKTFCPGLYSWDSGVCTYTSSDDENCGGCGLVCPNGTTCDGGLCYCPMGKTYCDMLGVVGIDGCRDLEFDEANCGSCGNACGRGETCRNGVCSGSSTSGGSLTTPRASCQNGQFRCDGLCVDPMNSHDNCGGCGSWCGETGVCISAQCFVVMTDAESCPLAIFGGEEHIDPASDPLHCGGCGASCSSGELCFEAACYAVGEFGFAEDYAALTVATCPSLADALLPDPIEDFRYENTAILRPMIARTAPVLIERGLYIADGADHQSRPWWIQAIAPTPAGLVNQALVQDVVDHLATASRTPLEVYVPSTTTTTGGWSYAIVRGTLPGIGYAFAIIGASIDEDALLVIVSVNFNYAWNVLGALAEHHRTVC